MSEAKTEKANRSGNPKLPVVLGHAACTGGSLIYRILVATFGMQGLSEVGAARVPSLSKYNPWDPQCQLFAQEQISAGQFSKIIFDRIVSCESQTDRRLLVREHTHSYYFNPIDPVLVPDGGSWYADCYREEFSKQLPCLVSVRNPVDSWLGFRRSFERQKPEDFDVYCQLYNQYLDKVDNDNKTDTSFHIFRYEDLIGDVQGEVDKIADHIGEPRRQVDLSLVGASFGSGNSGRGSTSIGTRSRRPFSRRFLKETLRSEHYHRLCERLGYQRLADDLTFLSGLKSHFYSVVARGSGVLAVLESPARWFKETLKSGKNIQ